MCDYYLHHLLRHNSFRKSYSYYKILFLRCISSILLRLHLMPKQFLQGVCHQICLFALFSRQLALLFPIAHLILFASCPEGGAPVQFSSQGELHCRDLSFPFFTYLCMVYIKSKGNKNHLFFNNSFFSFSLCNKRSYNSIILSIGLNC